MIEDILKLGSADASIIHGVVIGIVEDTSDKEGLGRVRLRFPRLMPDPKDRSDWARVVTPFSSKGAGAYFPLKLKDEVLVVFENGDINRPCVIGALWNGVDKLPLAKTKEEKSRDVVLIKSRSGHSIRLDDAKGKEKITISDKGGDNFLEFDMVKKLITIKSEKDITIDGRKGIIDVKAKDLEINATGKIDITATGPLNLKGSSVNLN